MQRHIGASIFNVVFGLLHFASIRMPQLCLFSLHAEARENIVRVRPLIRDKIEIGVGRIAMYPDELGVKARPVVREISGRFVGR